MLSRSCQTVGNIENCTIGSTEWISDLSNVLGLIVLVILGLMLVWRVLFK
jgi:hypothetical protein